MYCGYSLAILIILEKTSVRSIFAEGRSAVKGLYHFEPLTLPKFDYIDSVLRALGLLSSLGINI
jgi:hypothetical protein